MAQRIYIYIICLNHDVIGFLLSSSVSGAVFKQPQINGTKEAAPFSGRGF